MSSRFSASSSGVNASRTRRAWPGQRLGEHPPGLKCAGLGGLDLARGRGHLVGKGVCFQFSGVFDEVAGHLRGGRHDGVEETFAAGRVEHDQHREAGGRDPQPLELLREAAGEPRLRPHERFQRAVRQRILELLGKVGHRSDER